MLLSTGPWIINNVDRQEREAEQIAQLREILEEKCKFHSWWYISKKINKYKAMHDEYYMWDDAKYFDTDQLGDPTSDFPGV